MGQLQIMEERHLASLQNGVTRNVAARLTLAKYGNEEQAIFQARI
jgi:hypothetical protein